MHVTKLYRCFALSMAFLVFLSTAGLSVDMHFCNDQLKGISLIGKAANCHEKESHCKNSKKACHQKKHQESKSTLAKDDCCNNEHFILQMDVDFAPSSIDAFDESPTNLDLVFDRNIIFNEYKIVLSKCDLENYRPPPDICSRHILYQSFLC